MRMLVIGAGVLGSNLAKNLYKANKDVTLFARKDRYQQIKNGLIIRTLPDFRERTYYVRVIDELVPEDRYDVIFVCVQYIQLDELMPLLSSNVSSNIVFIGNNLKAEHYASLLKDKNVLFGFTLTAGRREGGKVISLDLKRITVGTLKGDKDRSSFVRGLFYNTGYKLKYEKNMGDFLRCHAAYVVPVAYGIYFVDGKIKKLVQDKRLLHTVIRANMEAFRALEKMGVALLPKEFACYRSKNYRLLNAWFFRLMSFTFLGKICAVDHSMSAVYEMGALAKDLEEILFSSGLSFKAYRKLKNGQSYI